MGMRSVWLRDCFAKSPSEGASQTVAMFSLVVSGASDKYLHWRAYFRYYRVPGEDHVIVGCALRIGFFIQGLSGFTFSGEVMIYVNNA